MFQVCHSVVVSFVLVHILTYCKRDCMNVLEFNPSRRSHTLTYVSDGQATEECLVLQTDLPRMYMTGPGAISSVSVSVPTPLNRPAGSVSVPVSTGARTVSVTGNTPRTPSTPQTPSSLFSEDDDEEEGAGNRNNYSNSAGRDRERPLVVSDWMWLDETAEEAAISKKVCSGFSWE
jgi:hypothetical protein